MYWSILIDIFSDYICDDSAAWWGESAVYVDTANNGRDVARQHGDAGVRRGGVACASGHVAATWRSASGQQTSIRAGSVCGILIIYTSFIHRITAVDKIYKQ